MNSIKRSMLAITLMAAFSSQAIEAENNMMPIDEYKEALSQAIDLYQDNDHKNALIELEKMAQMGEKKAQYLVGVMYLNGQGTEQDLEKSYAWLTVANEQKTSSWKKPLQFIESNISAEFLTVVSATAEQYVEKYGAKTQRLKCRTKRILGSKKGTHLCKKMELKPGFYFASSTS